jgi:hypothetical protein
MPPARGGLQGLLRRIDYAITGDLGVDGDRKRCVGSDECDDRLISRALNQFAWARHALEKLPFTCMPTVCPHESNDGQQGPTERSMIVVRPLDTAGSIGQKKGVREEMK